MIFASFRFFKKEGKNETFALHLWERGRWVVEGLVGKWEEEESFGAWKWGSEDVVFRVENKEEEDKAMP